MRHFGMILLGILLSVSTTACSTTKTPVKDLQEQAQNGENDTISPGVDSNNTNEVITDNKNDMTANVVDEDAEDLDNSEGDFEYTEEGLISPKEAKRLIQDTSDFIMMYIKNKDMESLSAYVDPKQGVRFTLYSFVNKDKDTVFDQEGIKNFFIDKTEYIWGYFDGSGDVVKMTPSSYYDEVFYHKDFANADQIGYNTILSGGNTLNNQFEVYDNPIIVEYYFEGFDPKYEGLDWESLSFVFEETDGKWYLVGIINNRNTV